jgi:hypothetical protein
MKLSRAEVKLSKTPRGRKLMAGILKELHRHQVVPVRGEMREAMRVEAARTLRDGGTKREATERILWRFGYRQTEMGIWKK